MRIFISSDLEGAAGIVDWEQCRPGGGPRYEEGCRLLLEEVNAAIAGAAAAGATSFLVNDSHGAMANLPPDALGEEASYLSGRHKPLYMMEGLDGSFDACFFVAYHGSMSSQGTLSHTYNPRAVSAVRLNGTVVGESGINALVAAHHGVPIALVTGDQIATGEAAGIAPGAELVAVKRSITRFAAESLHPDAARRMIRSAAGEAVRAVADGRVPPPAVGPDIVLETDWLTADMAEMATWVGGVRRSGERTTVISGAEAMTTYRSFVATIAITRSIVEA